MRPNKQQDAIYYSVQLTDETIPKCGFIYGLTNYKHSHGENLCDLVLMFVLMQRILCNNAACKPLYCQTAAGSTLRVMTLALSIGRKMLHSGRTSGTPWHYFSCSKTIVNMATFGTYVGAMFHVPCVYLMNLLVLHIASSAYGHGRLTDPPSRSSMWRYGFNSTPNYEDNQLYCGGFQVSDAYVSAYVE